MTGGICTLVPVRTKGSILAVCGVLFLAAACSSGGSGGGPAPLVEKSSAIAQGDAICKQLVADVDVLVSQFKSTHATPTEADARDFLVTTLLPRIDRGVGDLHRIGEPTKDRTGFDDAIIDVDKDLSALKQAVAADAIKVVNNKIPIFDKSAKLFTDYGFKECGKV
ncbi:MAG: hypothetical protein QOI95_1897 [Acidimicrobiaceae bacterium]|jgi:hypothetical protein